jgi:hypothetical protein
MADAAGLFSLKLRGRSVGIVPLSPVPRRQPKLWVIWLGVVPQFFRSRIAQSALTNASRNSSRLPVHLNPHT